MPTTCWPFHGCFGPVFPPRVTVDGKVFVKREAPKNRDLYRGMYTSEAMPPQWLVIKKDCTFEVRPSGSSTMPQVVGGSGDPSHDLSLSAGSLSVLAKTYPRAYANPNMEAGDLLKGALEYPWMVELNPVLSLLGLEDPALLRDIQAHLRTGWLESGKEKLSKQHLRLYACEIAASVLSDFEDEFPGNTNLRAALLIAIDFAKGKATSNQLAEAFQLAKQATSLARERDTAEIKREGPRREEARLSAYYAYYAAYAVYWCTVPDLSAREITLALEVNCGKKLGKEAAKKSLAERVRYYYCLDHPVFAEAMRNIKRQELYDTAMAQVRLAIANAFREEYYGKEAKDEDEKEKKRQKAIKQAEEGAMKIATMMSAPDPSPPWLGYGFVGATVVVAAILIGPEILAAAGIEGTMGLLEMLAAAETSAVEITGVAQASGITTVSMGALVDALESDVALAELTGGSAFLEGLIAKLSAQGLIVVEDAAAVVVKSAL